MAITYIYTVMVSDTYVATQVCMYVFITYVAI